MTHVVQYLTLMGRDAAGGEESAVFGLSHEGAHYGDAGGVGGNGMVERGVVGFIAEEVVASSDAAGVGSGEIGGVGEYAEDHGGCAEDFLAIWVGGRVAEEAVEVGDGGGSGVGLLGG